MPVIGLSAAPDSDSDRDCGRVSRAGPPAHDSGLAFEHRCYSLLLYAAARSDSVRWLHRILMACEPVTVTVTVCVTVARQWVTAPPPTVSTPVSDSGRVPGRRTESVSGVPIIMA